LPKEWAQFAEEILARDLGWGLLRPGEKFERIASRDEHQTTKISRYVHLERSDSVVTGNHLT
jgi:hypothetical protein